MKSWSLSNLKKTANIISKNLSVYKCFNGVIHSHKTANIQTSIVVSQTNDG